MVFLSSNQVLYVMWQSHSQKNFDLVLGNFHRGKFELNQSMVQIFHSNGQFTSLLNEDPQIHVRTFIDINNIYISIRVSSHYVRLTLFPYSLLEAEKYWLDSEPPNFITTRNDVAKKFLSQFFPSKKTVKLRGWHNTLFWKTRGRHVPNIDAFQTKVKCFPTPYANQWVTCSRFLWGFRL